MCDSCTGRNPVAFYHRNPLHPAGATVPPSSPAGGEDGCFIRLKYYAKTNKRLLAGGFLQRVAGVLQQPEIR